MRCSYPRTVGFQADGKTLCWSPKRYSKEFSTFELPCGKCLECRLEYGRSTAVRCVHEAKMHLSNVFITLTYSDEHLKSDRLQYSDIQTFIKKLRDHVFRDHLSKLGLTKSDFKALSKENRDLINSHIAIGLFVTGEYGDKNKRPHWHLLLFNYRPDDLKEYSKNGRGDTIYSSQFIDKLWGKNDPTHAPTQIGDVTFHSAGYVARYAAKKLVHGNDDDHDYHPIHKRSSRHAIGKRYLEKYWREIFTRGHCMIMQDDGTCVKTPIPRYYERWLQKNHPNEFIQYVINVKETKIQKAKAQAEAERSTENEINHSRLDLGKPLQFTKKQAQKIITQSKFDILQNSRNGD